jgi:WD40 repeat protein
LKAAKPDMDALITSHGQSLDHGGYGLAVLPMPKSLAFIFSDGRVAFGSDAPLKVSPAAIVSVAAQDGTLYLGGEDGTLRSVKADGGTRDIHNFGRKWIDHIACGDGVIAASCGKQLHLLSLKNTDTDTKTIDHSSSLTGLSFDARGKRLAVSHYNGVTLHWASGSGTPQLLEWKGSHIGVLLSPDAKFVVSAMQELALHGWKLPEAKNMRMAGYPAKTRSMAWTAKAKWLATSGAPVVVCWPFFHKDGPMGKGPIEFASPGPLVTAVACHPKRDILAAGLEDGSVLLFRMEDAADILVAPACGAAVSGIAFSGDGAQLGFTCENGSIGLLQLPL